MKNKVIIITGTPGVGKTSISRKVASKIEKSIVVSVDTIREMVISSYQSPATFTWNKELTTQGELAREAASKVVDVYYKNGFTVIIDDIVYGEYQLFWQRKLFLKRKTFFLLTQNINTILKRNNTRKKNKILKKNIILYLYRKFAQIDLSTKFIKIENRTQSETVQKIITYLSK